MLAQYNQIYTAYGKNSVSYNQGLPRPSQTFTEGAFGPLAPIIPQPIDAPRDDTGRPEPRRWQYPVGWNLPMGMPGTEGLKLVPFAQLRQYAELYSVVRACIELRKQEILALEWDIVPTEGAEKKMRADAGAHMDFMSRKEEAVAFFNHPDPNYNSFASWMSAMLEDVFVVDALAIYLHPSRKPGMGLFGTDLAALDVIDGTTIRPLLDIRGGKPKPPAPAFQQYMFGIPRTDMMDVIMQNDIKDLGEPAAQYRADQMLYLRTEPRTWTPYGFPGLERAIIPVLTGIKKQQYAMDWFTEGTIPGSWVIPGPDVSTPAQQRELQETLNAIAGDVGFKHKIIVLPPGSKSEAQKPLVLADQFDEVLMNQVMMAYEITPMELGVLPKVSATQSPSAANQANQSNSGINERKALKPMLMWLKRELFDYVLQRYCGQTDMQWSWKALDTNTDEQIQAATYKTLVSTGLMSVDEARVEMGKNPWGLPQTSDPVLITGTGVIPFGQISPQEEQAELGLPSIATAQDLAATETQQQQADAQSQALGGPGVPPPGGASGTPPAGGPPKPPAPGSPPAGGAPPSGGSGAGPTDPKTGQPLKTDESGKPLHPETGKPLHSDSPLLQNGPQAAPTGAVTPPAPPTKPVAQGAVPQPHPAAPQVGTAPQGLPKPPAGAHPPTSTMGKPPVHDLAHQPIPGSHPSGSTLPAPPAGQHPAFTGGAPDHATDPKTGQPVPNAHTATPEHAAVAGHGAPVPTPSQPTHDPKTGQPLSPNQPPQAETPGKKPTLPGEPAPAGHQQVDPHSGRPVPQIPPGGAHSPQAAPAPPGATHPSGLQQDEKGRPLHPETGKPLHSDSPLLKPKPGATIAPPGAPDPSQPAHLPSGSPSGATPTHASAPSAAPSGKPKPPAPTPNSPHDGIPLPPPQDMVCPACGGNGRTDGTPCVECHGTGYLDGNVQHQQQGVAGVGAQPAHPGASPLGPDGKPLPPSREPGAPNPQMQGGQRPQVQGNRASQEANTQTTPHNPVQGAGAAATPPARRPQPVAKTAASEAMLEELDKLRVHLKKRGTGGRRWQAEFLPQDVVDNIYDQLDDSARRFYE